MHSQHTHQKVGSKVVFIRLSEFFERHVLQRSRRERTGCPERVPLLLPATQVIASNDKVLGGGRRGLAVTGALLGAKEDSVQSFEEEAAVVISGRGSNHETVRDGDLHSTLPGSRNQGHQQSIPLSLHVVVRTGRGAGLPRVGDGDTLVSSPILHQGLEGLEIGGNPRHLLKRESGA